MTQPVTLYLVIPCYNEEAVLPETARRLAGQMKPLIASGRISPASRIAFVDDGSKDRTWTIISELYQDSPLFCGIRLSRNQGHQKALLAGLLTVRDLADVTISLDADLQDDIGKIADFLLQFEQGCEIVYGVRKSRRTDTFFKRTTAQAFYRFMRLMGVDVVYNHADYRLLSRRALDSLSQFHETNLFLRGIIPLLGYRTGTVYYDRHERLAGETKYPFKKMLAFAFDGLTSFSVRPIRLIMSLGLLIFAVSIALSVYFLTVYFLGRTVAGWATIAISIWAIGGLQLLAIGIIGEYIGKIYLETKARPRYFVEVFLQRED